MWKQFYNYEVSNLGEIRNLKTKRVLKGNLKKTGYLEYCLYINKEKKYYLGHILVAKLFLENPMEYNQVNHKDGNKLNNNVNNLEWVTSSENNLHAWSNNLNSAHILRPVKQYTLNNKYIQTFPSIISAVKATGASKIREVANGKRKSSGGYIWKWVEDFIPEDRGKAKKVAMLDENQNIIQTFNSVSEASRKTGANRKGISAVCLGKQKKCFNYFWKFINDDIVQ